METIINQWQQDTSSEKDTWHYLTNHPGVFGYAAKYVGLFGYNWQAARGDYRLSGSADTCEEAFKSAEASLALPIEEFNARIVLDLVEDLRALEKKILALAPHHVLLPGYSAGFDDGVAHVRHRIEEALA